MRQTIVQITDYTQPSHPQRYSDVFDEAYYDIDVHGNVDIALRRSAPSVSNPAQTITQIVHIKSFWRSIPGATVAEATQINGTVTYRIVSGLVGSTLEGAGSVFFKENRRKNRLTGRLEQSTLRPSRLVNAGRPLFNLLGMQGTFNAHRNPRLVRRLIREARNPAAFPVQHSADNTQ